MNPQDLASTDDLIVLSSAIFQTYENKRSATGISPNKGAFQPFQVLLLSRNPHTKGSLLKKGKGAGTKTEPSIK